MLTTLLQFRSRTFQLFDVTIQLFNVSLGLFGSQPLGFRARMFSLGAFAFSALGLCSGGANVFEIFLVGEIDDGDDWKRRQYCVKADRGFQLDDGARNKGADEIRHRRPEVMRGPGLPERSIGFTGQTDRYDPRVGGILADSYNTQN